MAALPADLPFPPVTVETAVVGRLRVVSSVRAAAEMLVSSWPPEKRTGKAYRLACEAALAALNGTLYPDTVRKAFIHAAQEAGIFVKEERDSTPRPRPRRRGRWSGRGRP